MLTALMAIYIASQSVVEHKGEFSDYVMLLCGIKQGAPPSGILYIAYTLDIINMYSNEFHPEALINIFHLLMHADDILLLATTRTLAIRKLRSLMKYCTDNFIKDVRALQIIQVGSVHSHSSANKIACYTVSI